MVDPRIQRELGTSFNLLSPEENHITRKRLWRMTRFGFQAVWQFFLEFSKRWDSTRPKRVRTWIFRDGQSDQGSTVCQYSCVDVSGHLRKATRGQMSRGLCLHGGRTGLTAPQAFLQLIMR